MSKSLTVFKKICKNLNSYEFTEEFKKGKKQIEKELKVLIVLKDLFDFDFALRFPNNQPMLKITNKRTNEYWEIPVAQEKYDLLKEVLKDGK